MDQDPHGRNSGHGSGHASCRGHGQNLSSSPAPSDESLAPSRAPQTILIGQAGVHLIMAKLLVWQIPAREAMSGLPYDIIADVPGTGFVRIQVKTTTRLQCGKLRFRMQRGCYYSPRGLFDYKDTDFDIAAFVHLPTGRGVFWAKPPRNVAFFPSWLEPPNVDHTTWLWALTHHAMAMSRRAAPQLTIPTATVPKIQIQLWPPRAPWVPPAAPAQHGPIRSAVSTDSIGLSEPADALPPKPRKRRRYLRARVIPRANPITIKGSRLP